MSGKMDKARRASRNRDRTKGPSVEGPYVRSRNCPFCKREGLLSSIYMYMSWDASKEYWIHYANGHGCKATFTTDELKDEWERWKDDLRRD